jgi:hypothetical protein
MGALMRLALIFLGSLAIAGCFSPDYKSGDWTCGEGGLCPEGFHCEDTRCVANGASDIDASVGGPDVRVADADPLAPDAPPEPPADADTTDADPTPSLTISFFGTGSGTIDVSNHGPCTSDCTLPLAANEQVVLTPSVDGSIFVEWGGACTGVSPLEVCTLSLTSDTTVTARFETAVGVSIENVGRGSGTFTFSYPGASCGADCVAVPLNVPLTLTATPDDFSSFGGWSAGGPCATAGNGECTFTPRDSTTVIAFFGTGGVRTIRTYGGPGDEIFTDVAIDPSNGIVTAVMGEMTAGFDFDGLNITFGGGANDVYILGIDVNGQRLWEIPIQSPGNDESGAITATGDGRFFATLVLGNGDGSEDWLILEINSSGTVIDAFSVRNDAGRIHPRDISYDPARDELVVVGSFEGNAQFGGPGATSNGDHDMFVFSVSWNGGRFPNVRVYGGAGRDIARAVTRLTNFDSSAVYVAGEFTDTITVGGRLDSVGRTDTVVFAQNSDGAFWNRQLGGPGDDIPTVLLSDEGGLILGGTFEGELFFVGNNFVSFGGSDSLFFGYTPSGSDRFGLQLGGPGDEFFTQADYESGQAVQAGTTNGPIELMRDLSGPILTPRGTDIFAKKNNDYAQMFGGPDADVLRAVSVYFDGTACYVGGFTTRFDVGNKGMLSSGGGDAFFLCLHP